jgi:GT2 family glycosyltransferase/ubiquinone/menaquinone biosynthesis C-methylase UbiE
LDYTVIVDEINKGNWEAASVLLENADAADDYVSILKASVYEHYEKYGKMFEHISAGLKYNGANYELYVMLGNYYMPSNINRAYLCYENALFYCDNEDDCAFISGRMNEIKENVSVKPCSIVIVSYNNKQIMQDCIESIRKNNINSSYELVVVDNASSDGVCEWLKEQEDIILIENKDNKGFGYACNQGVKAAAPENDIFFLNNDTVVMPNSIFWLRMGLYDNERNGAVGCMSNYVANGQMISEKLESIEDYYTYALNNNVPMENAYELKVWLSGFAMLIARHAMDITGCFDLCYGSGYYEDDDLGIRIQMAGYRSVLCRNSFIFHYGNKSFGRECAVKQCQVNREVFRKKWGFNAEDYTYPRNDLIALIDEDKNDDKRLPIRVLDIGCGWGATLSRIKYSYPDALVKGIEKNGRIAHIGANSFDIIHGDIENMELPFEKGYFDYIILTDTLTQVYSPEKVLSKIKPYLSSGGKLICSIPNIMHASVILPLLKGNFDYKDEGVLDKKNIRFFTLQTIYQLLTQEGYKVEAASGIREDESVIAQNKELADEIHNLMDKSCADLLYIYQFTIKAQAE